MTNEQRRQELDPPSSTQPRGLSSAPPEQSAQVRADDGEIQERIRDLVQDIARNADEYDARLVRELITAALKLIPDGRNRGELKLMTAAMKELRYAFRVFGQYPEPHKVTIFGSARTPPDHPDYRAAVQFGRIMAQRGWMVITGAGDGIMRAGHEGPGREASFGVAIRLPFETTANNIIADDEKLIHFRYFFTRKLMFLSQAEAVVCFPGGFGTLDETFETLTLVQTGKASMIPIVFVEGEPEPGLTVAGGDPDKAIAGYWKGWKHFIDSQLMQRGWISPEDDNLFYIAADPTDAADHVLRFYRNYHSSRYVRDELVIRLNKRLRLRDIEALNDEFPMLVKKGRIAPRTPLDVEEDHLHLPRISFVHTRRGFGFVRRLIDRINQFDPVEE
ncbi:MAG: LOG family protein [Leptolyngbya sp. PLA3]|nr:MAG: LOG family protein [Cyanobacteria bacterium CYA]MCE7967260.1 LOG family protein [Leptolyngbya sp. PL-A3]